MADPKQLEILKSGVKEWNNWREQNPHVAVELSGADLSETALEGADLRGAYLFAANLNEAELAGADLSDADLSLAGLRGADLSGTNLSATELRGTNFHAALMEGTHLRNAHLRATVFADLDLSQAIGLDTCVHVGPSSLDYHTLIRCGTLPLVFLRGCGLPDTVIDYMPSLLGTGIEFYSCFISYSTVDQSFAERLHADLQNKGVRCWFAPHAIQAGKKIHEQIDEAIRLHDKQLLILSPASMNSEWVKTEIAKARKREIREERRMLFPVRLVDFDTLRNWECFDADTGKDSAREIREYFIPDFSNWKADHDAYSKAFDRLRRDLKAEKQALREDNRGNLW
jgi:hypothetical protein